MKMESDEKNKAVPAAEDESLGLIVMRLYLPDASDEPEEVLPHSEILNSVRNIDPECDGKTLLRVMDKLQYPSRTIEGELYWFVKTP